MKIRLTKTERLQVEALDVLCRQYELALGTFSRGGKHGRYTIELPGGKETFITISCTPECIEFAVQRNERNFRHNIVRTLGWTK